MTQFMARPAWVAAPLIVLALLLGACSGSPQNAGAVAGSESPGTPGSSASPGAPAAGSGAGPGATAATKGPASSGPSATKQAGRAGTTTTTAVNGAAGPGSAPRPASSSGSATVAP